MEIWGHEVIVVGDNDVESLIGLDIMAFQMAEGGAMGYPGGAFFVTPASKVSLPTITRRSPSGGDGCDHSASHSETIQESPPRLSQLLQGRHLPVAEPGPQEVSQLR